MAIRLEKAFGVSYATLLRMQAAYDIARAGTHAKAVHVRRYRAPARRMRAAAPMNRYRWNWAARWRATG